MAGTVEGGMAARDTNKEKYGADFYAKIGAKGGKNGRTGGFYASKDYPLDHPANPTNAGSKGGHRSKRGPKLPN